MLKYYPSHVNLKNRFSKVCSQHFGIMESQILMVGNSQNAPSVSMCTSNMPDYHKLIVHENAEMSYHLAGYGVYQEEAMIRLLGEGIERYALVVAAKLFKDKVIYASYNEMKNNESKGEDNIMPWEYINIYSEEDYVNLSKKTNIRSITKDDKIGWLKCASIFDAGKEIFIPSQLLFTGMRLNENLGEKLFAPGFSKGSAAHTDLKKALKSAIMEAIEADAFMIKWYTNMKSKKIILDDTKLLEIISQFTKNIDHEIIAYQYSMDDMPGHTFGLGMLNRKDERPVAVLGCQASLNPINGIYRGMFEALAIHYLASNGPIIVPQHYLDSVKEKDYNNLDTNVAYWANAENAEFKRSFLRSKAEGEVPLSSLKNYTSNDDEEIGYILNKLKGVSKYGVYLDITPPEVADKGWKVVRTFFPEFVQMSLPAFPYSNHPRLIKYGGVQNVLPHPVP